MGNYSTGCAGSPLLGTPGPPCQAAGGRPGQIATLALLSERRRTDDGGTRLSFQTLIVASLASLTAAIVTSTFWQRGTPITAALTPVIVAIASELYSRPARRIGEFGSRASQVRNRRFVHEDVRARERVPSGPARDPWAPDSLSPPDEPELGPIRVYRTEQRSSPIRRVHIRAALLTAAIAFVIATAVLTLPELVFGGSVASRGSTTFFGGGHSSRHESTTKHESKTQTTPSKATPTTSTPTQSTPTVTAPPAQTTPQTTGPTQQLPSAGSPAPTPSATTPAQTPPGQ